MIAVEAHNETPGLFRKRLPLVLVFTFALRISIRLATGTAGYWNNGYANYKLLADSLVAGHGYALPGLGPTAFRVPGYSLLIAAATWGGHSPWPLLVAQALVSCLLVLVAGLMARRLFGDAAGLIAAAWCAAYPYYAWHDLSLQESGLFAALAAGATLLLFRLRGDRAAASALAAGAVLGAAILTRAMLIPFALLALAWLLLPDESRHALRSRFASAALVAAALLAVLSPWLAYTRQVDGRIHLGTETGQSLYAGASPLLFARFPGQQVDRSRALVFAAIPPEQQAERDRFAQDNPARESEWYRARALEVIAADPLGYAARALRKLAIAFGPFPAPLHGWWARVGYCAWWVPLLVLGVAGLWRDRAHHGRNLLIGAHFASFAAVTAAIWAQTAHRAYLDVYLMVFASPVLLTMLPRRWREALAG